MRNVLVIHASPRERKASGAKSPAGRDNLVSEDGRWQRSVTSSPAKNKPRVTRVGRRMGKYDDITPERLRSEMLRFARLLVTMDEEGVLLEKTPSVLRLLGELRQMLFAYEVRHTNKLLSGDLAAKEAPRELDPLLEDSARIVEDALRREKELQEELERRLFRRDKLDES